MSVMPGRVRAFAFVAALLCALCAQAVVPDLAGAASTRVTRKDACKILTKRQLQQLMASTATFQGQNGTKLDVGCNWAIGASADRPAGTLRLVVSFAVPPGAYKALKSNPQFQVVDGLGVDALYSAGNGTLSVFKGTRILRLRGLFYDATVRPIKTYDPKLALLVLAKAADARL